MNSADGEIKQLMSDIVFWGTRLEAHIAGLTFREFEQTDVKADAVCWCIVCIGEAAGRIRNLAPDLSSGFPDLEFSKAYAMRNRIAHGYHSLDLGLIWLTATDSVPRLVEVLRARLRTS